MALSGSREQYDQRESSSALQTQNNIKKQKNKNKKQKTKNKKQNKKQKQKQNKQDIHAHIVRATTFA